MYIYANTVCVYSSYKMILILDMKEFLIKIKEAIFSSVRPMNQAFQKDGDKSVRDTDHFALNQDAWAFFAQVFTRGSIICEPMDA